MKIAALDVGSHTLKLCIATISDKGAISVLGDFAHDVGIGPHVRADHTVDATGIERQIHALLAFRQILDSFGEVAQVRITGSTLLQQTPNAGEILETIQRLFGAPLQAVPPGEGAAYAFLGSWDTVAPVEGTLTVLADVEGGCTQVIVGQGRQIFDVAALDLDTHALARRFLPGHDPSAESLALCQHVTQTLDCSRSLSVIAGRPFQFLGSGGPLASCAAMALGVQGPPRDMLHGLVLPYETLTQQFDLIAVGSSEELSTIVGLGQAWLPAHLAALAIWILLLEKLSAPEVVVSANGSRHGLLREICGLDRPIQ